MKFLYLIFFTVLLSSKYLRLIAIESYLNSQPNIPQTRPKKKPIETLQAMTAHKTLTPEKQKSVIKAAIEIIEGENFETMNSALNYWQILAPLCQCTTNDQTVYKLGRCLLHHFHPAWLEKTLKAWDDNKTLMTANISFIRGLMSKINYSSDKIDLIHKKIHKTIHETKKQLTLYWPSVVGPLITKYQNASLDIGEILWCAINYCYDDFLETMLDLFHQKKINDDIKKKF